MDLDYSWNNISNDEFLTSAMGMENRITLIWIPSLFHATQSRKCKIDSSEKWIGLMNKSLIPRYKQNKLPEDLSAELFSLDEYCIQTNYPEKMTAISLLKTAPSIQITTAYDTNSNSRLIIDGLKRAIGIQQLILNSEDMPESTIMECYGTGVSRIFPMEFMHIK